MSTKMKNNDDDKSGRKNDPKSSSSTTTKKSIKCIQFMIELIIMFTIITTYIVFVLWLLIHLTSASYWDRFFHQLPGSFRNDDTNRNIVSITIEFLLFLFMKIIINPNNSMN